MVIIFLEAPSVGLSLLVFAIWSNSSFVYLTSNLAVLLLDINPLDNQGFFGMCYLKLLDT